MRKIILIGRVAAGKTTLTQALRGEEIKYFKTQYVNYLDTVIDTPGEYTELRQTSGALALYAYEADVVGLVLSANEPYSIFSPCITSLVNREVIGIVSGIDKPDANVERVARWLRLAGCKRIFPVSAITGEGLADIIAYLEEDESTAASSKAGMGIIEKSSAKAAKVSGTEKTAKNTKTAKLIKAAKTKSSTKSTKIANAAAKGTKRAKAKTDTTTETEEKA